MRSCGTRNSLALSHGLYRNFVEYRYRNQRVYENLRRKERTRNRLKGATEVIDSLYLYLYSEMGEDPSVIIHRVVTVEFSTIAPYIPFFFSNRPRAPLLHSIT